MSDKRTAAIKQATRDKKEALLLKKNALKFSDAPVLSPILKNLKEDEPNKALLERDLPLDKEDAVYRTVIANTYNYMDSHDDVHLNNVFKKSLEETKKLFLLHDHKFEVTAQTGNIMKAYEQEGRFIYYGYNSPLDTQALLLDVEIEKAKNELVFNEYKEHRINQHSVGMYYVKIDLAIDNQDDKEAYALYRKYLPQIGNADEVEKQGYFFAVQEAKLKETSAVLQGSNPLTGIFDNNKSLKNDDEAIKMFDYLAKNIENKEIFNNICSQYVDTFKKKQPLLSTGKTKKPSFYTTMSKF
jgi:transketolase